MLPSLFDTTSLSSSSIYSESSTHPSSESSALCSLSSSMKSLYPMLQKTNISLTGHGIFCLFDCQHKKIGSNRVLSCYRKEVCFKTNFSLAVFSKTTKVEFLFCGWHGHDHKEQGPCSAVQNVLMDVLV